MSATDVKKLLNVLAIETRPLIYFSSLVMNEGASLFFASLMLKFLYLSKLSFIYLMFSLKRFVKYFSLALLRSVDKRFL